MSAMQIEIQLIAVVVAVACALPGVFLVLRRMALMSDAISHAILLGIVLGFFIVEDITSPVLVISAVLIGIIMVSLVELLTRTGLVKKDAAIGLIFPALFSLGVILISRFAGNVHLDFQVADRSRRLGLCGKGDGVTRSRYRRIVLHLDLQRARRGHHCDGCDGGEQSRFSGSHSLSSLIEALHRASIEEDSRKGDAPQ